MNMLQVLSMSTSQSESRARIVSCNNIIILSSWGRIVGLMGLVNIKDPIEASNYHIFRQSIFAILSKVRRNFLDAFLERKREWNIDSYIIRTEDPEGNPHFTHIEASDENGGKAYTCNAHNMKLRSIERGERQVLRQVGNWEISEILRRSIRRGYKVNLIINQCVYSMIQ